MSRERSVCCTQKTVNQIIHDTKVLQEKLVETTMTMIAQISCHTYSSCDAFCIKKEVITFILNSETNFRNGLEAKNFCEKHKKGGKVVDDDKKQENCFAKRSEGKVLSLVLKRFKCTLSAPDRVLRCVKWIPESILLRVYFVVAMHAKGFSRKNFFLKEKTQRSGDWNNKRMKAFEIKFRRHFVYLLSGKKHWKK